MAGKSSDSSLTTYLWNNLNNAQIDIQLLKNFELNDEETARKKFGQAIKNIKGRKKYNAKTMKSLLNKVNADLKEFLNKNEIKQYFLRASLVQSINQEEVSRELFRSTVRDEEYRNMTRSLKRSRSSTSEEDDHEDQEQEKTPSPGYSQGEASAQAQDLRETTPPRQYQLFASRESTAGQYQTTPPYHLQHEGHFQESFAAQFGGSTRGTTPMVAQTSPAQGNSGPNEINSQEDIWACWQQHLENDTLHEYSLERLGIIQCGSSLQCNPNYPQELYDLLVFDNTRLDNPINNHHQIFDEIFDTADNQEQMLQLLDAISYDQKKNKEIAFVYAVLTTLLSRAPDNDIASHEADFSYFIVWPLIDAVAKAVNGAKFNPGEYHLEAIAAEFDRRRIGNKQHYKADGCISLNINNAKHELVLLEVSGHYKLKDEPRFTKDHVKAGYGLVAMLNQIVYQYKYASFEIFTAIRLYFVHVKNTKLRLWSFEMASPGIYILNLVDSQTLPDSFATSELALESLCIELWNLKEMLDSTILNIQLLAKSDAENQRAFNRKRRGTPNLKPTLLPDALKITPQVKLGVNRINDYQELDICSSLR